MLFPTFQFLAFFVVVFPIYWAIGRHRLRLGWLLAASCVFYVSFQPWLILLILFSASVDYYAAKAIEDSASAARRKALLMLSISINLGLLACFKYVNFFLASASGFLGLFKVAWTHTPLDLALPLGISFYTFETISYIVDVYLGRTKAARSPLDYALFIMFFPHLVAGPIVRPRDFLPQLERCKRFQWDRMYLALRFFLRGLIKKAVIADHLGAVVDPVFKTPAAYGSAATWLAVLAYAVQIYCDFSGYSDMAIGLAHSLGFKLPLNFAYPYLAANPAEFWRRWHISLSSWLRDYLYKPLGGNQRGVSRTYANLILVMLLGGLWHGASWTFVVWGLYHGVWLALHRAVPMPKGVSRLKPMCILGTFLMGCVGWVFFRAQSFSDAGLILTRMFAPVEGMMLKPATAALVLTCLALVFLEHWLGTNVSFARAERRVPAPLMGAAWAALLLLTLLLFPEKSTVFIYFQF